jgi:hypothetical protein
MIKAASGAAEVTACPVQVRVRLQGYATFGIAWQKGMAMKI